MKPVTPPPIEGTHAIVIASDQPEYQPLPSAVDAEGRVITEWEPTEEERAAIAAGGRVRLTIWTFRQPLQPVLVEAVPFRAAGEA